MDITNTAKTIADLVKKGANLEAEQKIIQLREEALELKEENLKLKTENLELKKKQELSEKVIFKNNVYYLEGDETPFCPYCYEKNKLLIHLKQFDDAFVGMKHLCPNCQDSYTLTNGSFELSSCQDKR